VLIWKSSSRGKVSSTLSSDFPSWLSGGKLERATTPSTFWRRIGIWRGDFT
jgi:hypothetical protein